MEKIANIASNTGGRNLERSRPLYTRITVGALLAIAVASIIPVIVQEIEGVDTGRIIAPVVSAVVAGLIWRFGSWLLFLAPLVGAGGWLMFSSLLKYDAASFQTFFDFAPTVVVLVAGVIAFIGGPLAFFQGRRPTPRAATTGLESGLLGVIALAVTALVIASGVASIVGRSSVSAEDKATAEFTLKMQNTRFVPASLELPGSRIVRVLVENNDLIVHTFTVDDLDLDYNLGGRSEKLVELPAIVPGAYQYTCEVWGHEDMKGLLVVTAD